MKRLLSKLFKKRAKEAPKFSNEEKRALESIILKVNEEERRKG